MKSWRCYKKQTSYLIKLNFEKQSLHKHNVSRCLRKISIICLWDTTHYFIGFFHTTRTNFWVLVIFLRFFRIKRKGNVSFKLFHFTIYDNHQTAYLLNSANLGFGLEMTYWVSVYVADGRHGIPCKSCKSHKSPWGHRRR